MITSVYCKDSVKIWNLENYTFINKILNDKFSESLCKLNENLFAVGENNTGKISIFDNYTYNLVREFNSYDETVNLYSNS